MSALGEVRALPAPVEAVAAQRMVPIIIFNPWEPEAEPLEVMVWEEDLEVGRG